MVVIDRYGSSATGRGARMNTAAPPRRLVHANPLVGRAEELELIQLAMQSASTSGIVLAGMAGVGKTRLAVEALTAARSGGWATEWAVAMRAAATLPFGALARMLPQVEPSGRDRLALMQRALANLQARAGDRRLALGIDDAHLLDDDSAMLVHQLATGGRVFVVVTVRSDEPAPEPIIALWKDGLAERVEVQALARREVADLAGALLGGRPDGATVEGLWRATRGNALFLRELLLAGLETGRLREADGVWRWHGSLGGGARLQAVLESRLEGVSRAERAVLELVSVGEPLEVDLLERLASPAAIDAIERKGLLVVEQDDRRLKVRLTHPLYAELLRATPSLRTRAAARLLASALARTALRRYDDRSRMTIWRLQAGVRMKPRLLVAAARYAQAASDHELAERLARAAVDGGSELAAVRTLGQSLAAQGRAGDAEAVLSRRIDAQRSEEEQTQLAIARAENLYWGLGRTDQADQVLRQAEREVLDPGRRDELTTAWAAFRLHDGRCLDALTAVADVLAHPGRGDRAALRALTVAAVGYALAGQPADALASAEQGLRLAPRWRREISWAEPELGMARCEALAMAGRLADAETAARTGYQDALARRRPEASVAFALELGHVALARGRARTAREWLRESVAVLRERDPHGLLAASLAAQARAAALVGDLPAAEASLAEADALGVRCAAVTGFPIELARPWVSAARGEVSWSVEQALLAAGLARESGQAAIEAVALHDAARLGAAVRVRTRLAGLASRLDGAQMASYAAAAAALADGDPAALERAAGAFEAAGMSLLAAEVGATAAARHHAAGRVAAAGVVRTRAARLAARCEGASTPALWALQPPTGLTRREREVAALAASGLPSRSIAERLMVSKRTVDNHLGQAYAKLGIATRAELAAALDTHGQS